MTEREQYQAEYNENKIIKTLELVSQSNHGKAFNQLSREQMVSVQDEVENLY